MMRARRKHQLGLSMIELMISITISLLLMAAVIQMFVGSRVTYSVQSELAKLQESARFAMEFMTKDLRMTGYMGCAPSDSLLSVLDDSSLFTNAEWTQNLDFTDGGAGSGAPDPSDTITIKFADLSESCTVESSTSTYFTCEANHNFTQGDILIASDCSHSAVFQMSNQNNNGTVARIDHNTGTQTPGNCTKGLGAPLDCSSTNGTDYSWPENTTLIQRFRAYTYNVATNNFGQPALYRQGLTTSGGSAQLENEELVEGVESMQVLLGFDTDDDNVANCYSNSTASCGTGITLDNVVALRISLLMRSTEDNVVTDSQTYVFNGDTITATDNRLRKVFTTTVAIRNRML
ncbi:MAG: PilW family protein [Pontibacterium sp.]